MECCTEGKPGKEYRMTDSVDLMKKAFLAGVGAAAEGTEKADQLLKDMIKKGEITVEQGKTLNEELKHNLDQKLHQRDQKDAGADVSSILKNLSEDDLKELKKRLAEVDADDKQQDENL